MANYTVNWEYAYPQHLWAGRATPTRMNQTEIPMVHCNVGETVELRWDSSNHHDVWQLYTEDAYIGCNFSSPAIQRSSSGAAGSYVFHCDTMGNRFFACSVGDACSSGRQRIRVHVVNESRTAHLRAQNVVTLADYMRASERAYKGSEGLSDARADQFMDMLSGIVQHSPDSCADWVLPSNNNNATCLAIAYTDMGVTSRVRATPNYEMAEAYYEQALGYVPSMCTTQAYLVELAMARNNRSATAEHYARACSACGPGKVDIEAVKSAFAFKGWSVPPGTACSPTAVAGTSPSTASGGQGQGTSPAGNEDLSLLADGISTRRTLCLVQALAVMWLSMALLYLQ